MDTFGGLPSFLTITLGLSQNSVRHVLSRWRIFLSWLKGRTPTCELAVAFLYELKNIGRNNNTLNTYIFSLRMVDKFFTDQQLPGLGFSQKLNTLPKRKAPIEILTIDEVKKIIATHVHYGKFRGLDCNRLQLLYTTMTLFLATTGARYSEASQLKIRYVNLYDGRVTFVDTKNKDWRHQWIREPLISQLKTLIGNRDGEELVFTTMTGHIVPAQNYIDDLHVRCKIAGISKRVHPHLFRHSYATDLYQNGVGLGEIQVLLGHKDIKTTIGYIHQYEERLITASQHYSLHLNSMSFQQARDFVNQKIQNLHLERFNVLTYQYQQTDNRLLLEVSGLSPPLTGGSPRSRKTLRAPARQG